MNIPVYGFVVYFQLHQAALTSLKGEIIELRSRLQRENLERDSLEKQLNKLHVGLGYVN